MSDDTKVRNVRIDFTDSHQESKGTVHGPVARLDHGTDRRNCLIQGGWDRAFGGNVERQGRDYREIFLICRDEPASGWRRETDFFQEVILGCVRRAHRPGNTQKCRRKIVFAAASQMFQRQSTVGNWSVLKQRLKPSQSSDLTKSLDTNLSFPSSESVC